MVLFGHEFAMFGTKLIPLVCLIGGGLLGLSAPAVADDPHPAVRAALDWQLPAHACGAKPLLRKGSDYANETHETVLSDVDHYTRERHERKLKRWDKCMTRYRKALMQDFGELKDSVRHGMTQAQAEAVLSKLKLIQDTIDASTER